MSLLQYIFQLLFSLKKRSVNWRMPRIEAFILNFYWNSARKSANTRKEIFSHKLCSCHDYIVSWFWQENVSTSGRIFFHNYWLRRCEKWDNLLVFWAFYGLIRFSLFYTHKTPTANMANNSFFNVQAVYVHLPSTHHFLVWNFNPAMDDKVALFRAIIQWSAFTHGCENSTTTYLTKMIKEVKKMNIVDKLNWIIPQMICVKYFFSLGVNL